MAMTQPPSKSPQWPEKDELCLLSAVLEIAREPAESYDPRVNLFDRIGKSLVKPFTNKEVLGKVKELKARYERRSRAIRVGSPVVKRTAAFKISEKIWGDASKDDEEKRPEEEEEKKAAESFRASDDSKTCHGQKVEHLEPTKPKPTACAPKTNPHEASRPGIKRAHEPTEKRDDATQRKNRRRKRVNPSNKKQEDEGAHFNCGKPGHFAHNCPEKEFEKNPAKQKETEELQPEAENKREEQSCTLISASFQPVSHQITPQKTQQRAEGHNSPQPSAHHRICPQKTQQRAEIHNSPQPGAHRFTPQKTQQGAQVHNRFNIPQPGAHQLPSDQNRVNVSNNFRPGDHRPTFEETNVVNRFQHGRSPQHWNKGSPLPPISPPPWAPRPPIVMPFPPPPQMPYRYPPPHRMNYTLPRNYNNPPTTKFNQSPAAPNYHMFNPTIPGPITNFSPSPPPPNYPMFN